VATGKCELERICSDINKKDYMITCAVERSIQNSFQLTCLHTVIIKPNFDVDYAYDKIVEIKCVPASKNEPLLWLNRLREVLCNIKVVNNLIAEIHKLAKEPFDPSNSQHEAQLEELWDLLRPGVRRDKGRKTLEWQEIGFQGKDPATDFRGMGILSLANLVYFAKNCTEMVQIILSPYMANSTPSSPAFPFAISGINITSMVLNLCLKGEFNEYFYVYGSTVREFHELYCDIFTEFNTFYWGKKPKDIMTFNKILVEFRREICKSKAFLYK